jgi:uncharacterized RDD family membrane protein YckC
MSQAGSSADLSPQQGNSMHHNADGVRPKVSAVYPKVGAVHPEVGAVHPEVGAVHPKVDAVPWEARPFQGQRAGIVTRTAANVLDSLLVVGVLACGYAAWCAVRFLVSPKQFSFPTVSFFAVLICGGIVLFTYFTVAWATTGRTFGDQQLGLRVVNPGGDPVRWPLAVVRAGFCVLLPIGLYWAILSPTNRSVQDSVLRTSVVYDWTVRRRPPPRSSRPG